MLVTRPRLPSWSLLALAVALPELAALAVKDRAGEPVTAFVAVKLGQDAAPVAFVVDEAEQVERLDEAAQLLRAHA